MNKHKKILALFTLAFFVFTLMPVGTVFAENGEGINTASEPKTIYLKGNADGKAGGIDTNDGLTADTAVGTIQKALELAGEGGKIVITKDVSLGESLKISNVTIERAENHTGTLLVLTGTESNKITVTLENVTIDGKNININEESSHYSPLIKVNDNVILDIGVGTKICNNKSTGIVMQGAASTINIKGGEICNNQSSNFYGGGVHVFAGSLNMTNGKITSNNSAVMSGGAICVMSDGSVKMNGGSITGNSAKSGGGAICTYGTFEMNGGTISNNAAGNNGGGVSIQSSGTFTLKNGKVEGNTATAGGGITILGDKATFNMNGGEISNNKITGGKGGGVLVYAGTFNASGTPIIKGNTAGSDNNVVNNNVYLNAGKVITIENTLENMLSGDDAIGVTTSTVPTAESPVSVTAAGTTDYSNVFFSDKTGYFVENKSDDNHLDLVLCEEHLYKNESSVCDKCGEAHEHTWSYSASGAVITEKCGNTTGGSLMISAPSDSLVYGDSHNKAASVTGEFAANISVPEIYYTGINGTVYEKTTAVPLNAGSYQASITLGEGVNAVTASVEYTIAPAPLTITADDKTATVGDAKPALTYQVTSGKLVDGDSIDATLHCDVDMNKAGTYPITITLGNNANYDITTEDGTLTVSKKQSSSSTDSSGGSYSPSSDAEVISPDADVTVKTETITTSTLNEIKDIAKADDTLTVIGGRDSAVNITARENGKAVTSFDKPVTVTVPVSPSALKTVADTSKLTLALVTEDAKGNTVLEYVGGNYDAKAKTFTAYISKPGNYVLVEKADIIKIELTINERIAQVNGSDAAMDTHSRIVNSRTLTPLRFVVEHLAGDAHWDGATRTVTIYTAEGKTLTMTIGEELPGFGVAPQIYDNRTLVPVAYIAYALDAHVQWVADEQKVIIVK